MVEINIFITAKYFFVSNTFSFSTLKSVALCCFIKIENIFVLSVTEPKATFFVFKNSMNTKSATFWAIVKSYSYIHLIDFPSERQAPKTEVTNYITAFRSL